MRISDWSSDVCSSDLGRPDRGGRGQDRQAGDRRGRRTDRHHDAADPAGDEPMTQKLALVTGGLHRVGAAIAARLAREGYALALHRHNPAEVDAVLVEALAETGADSRHFAADLSDQIGRAHV